MTVASELCCLVTRCIQIVVNFLMISVFSAVAAIFQTMEESDQGGSEGEDNHGKSQETP